MVGPPVGSVTAGDARTELWMVAMAGAGWIGAMWSWPPTLPRTVPVVVAILLGAAAFSARTARWRWPLFVVAALLAASHLGARADDAYRPLAPAPYSGPATVIGDPEPSGPGWSVELRLPDGERVLARAFGRWGVVVADATIGQRVDVDGRLSPVTDQPWLRTRHIVGHLAVDRVVETDPPGRLHAVPTYLRERIAAGAKTMPDRRRALYLGLVIGDDRMQPLGQKLRFNAAGLTHLLAVSGQNVAFALAVARPALQLFDYRGRFVGLLIVLVLFAVITRLEPSVLRATATAAITAWAAMSGRERTGLTVLSVAVLLLILIDPFLVRSVGFQLSVAASGAILLFGPLLRHRLPGPRWLAEPLAVTLSAQLGVSPLLIGYFGPVSVASIPANVFAGWAAAGVMTLGLTVGIVAGLMPESVASALQVPSDSLVWWIEAVAARHSALPAPRLGLLELVVVMAAVLLVRMTDRWRLRSLPLAVIVAVSLTAVPRPPAHRVECGPGLVWYPATDAGEVSVLTLSGDAYPRAVSSCLGAGVGGADVLVLQRGGASSARIATAIDEVMEIGTTLAPPQHRVIGARRQLDEIHLPASTGALVVAPTSDRSTLEVRFCCYNGSDG